jgi:hypothetical protein
MARSVLLSKLKNKASKEFSKESLKKRADPKTTGSFWKKVRNIAGTIGAGLLAAAGFTTGTTRLVLAVSGGLLEAVGAIAHADTSGTPDASYK